MQELIQQGEQLDNIERNTEHINQSVKTSQIYLNNIKSVFGGLKNWWQGKKDVDAGSAVQQTEVQQNSPAVHLRHGSMSEYCSGPLAQQNMQASAITATASCQDPRLQKEAPVAYESQLNNDLGK